MFNNSAPINKEWEEGTVTEVDSKRRVCKVKTNLNKNLVGVRWMSPDGGSTRFGSLLY